jgi:hypothetical protein
MTHPWIPPPRTLLKVLAAGSMTLTFAAACGGGDTESGIFDDRNAAGNQGGSSAAAGGSAGTYTGTSGSPPVFGGSGGSGTSTINDECPGVAFAAEPLPVDMYIMFDKSTSMDEELGSENRKIWDSATAAIRSFVQNPRAAGIGVALQYFGLPDTCNPDAYAVPEVPLGRLPGVANDIIASLDRHAPSTLTPTAPAVDGALRYMRAWAATNPDRAAVVVLVTDGFPTQCGVQCSVDTDCQGGSCQSGMCAPNSISEIEALAKRYADMDPPILTFVVGFSAGLANLNNIARGGGTGQAFLIESGDIEEQFVNAMLSISSTPLACDFDIPEPEDDNLVFNKDLVQVIYTPHATRQPEEIPYLTHAGACSINQGRGWYYSYDDNNHTPTKIHICADTCKRFAAGSVSIKLGCAPRPGRVE